MSNKFFKFIYVYSFQVIIKFPPCSLLLDSVKLGVPSVQVGVEPSTEAGGVQHTLQQQE